jgi:Superoxide dismutase
MAFKLPELGYAYDALEPNIDARTMEIHHSNITTVTQQN